MSTVEAEAKEPRTDHGVLSSHAEPDPHSAAWPVARPAAESHGERDRSPLQAALIIGSTREGREGAGVAAWFTALARQHGRFTVDVLDLADFHFPERHPSQPTRDIAAFTARLEAAEAFIVITPEYNRSFPASLKQAIDFAYDEWHAKPVGFVSYGCNSVGMHAVEQLRSVFTELHAVTVRDSVSFDLLHERDTSDTERAVAAMLGQLAWWGGALREARAWQPYYA